MFEPLARPFSSFEAIHRQSMPLLGVRHPSELEYLGQAKAWSAPLLTTRKSWSMISPRPHFELHLHKADAAGTATHHHQHQAPSATLTLHHPSEVPLVLHPLPVSQVASVSVQRSPSWHIPHQIRTWSTMSPGYEQEAVVSRQASEDTVGEEDPVATRALYRSGTSSPQAVQAEAALRPVSLLTTRTGSLWQRATQCALSKFNQKHFQSGTWQLYRYPLKVVLVEA